ncbi:spore coat protein U [Serratia sp. Leaf50]|nr:spore coat protein U [Serratia sp. Leaf50]
MWLRKIFLLGALGLCPTLSYAITCTFSGGSNVNFGTVTPMVAATYNTSMTFNYSCTKGLLETLAGANMCINIGASTSTSQINPRTMATTGTPSSSLNYQLYQGSVNGTVWGSQYVAGSSPVIINLGLLSALVPTTGSLTVYGQLLTPQTTAAPGSYTDNFTAVNASATYNVGLLVPPAGCGTTAGPTFSFIVMASITKQCNVTTNGNISLGPVNNRAVNTTSSNTFSVNCTNTTPYTVGLSPSNNNTAGSGVMVASAPNADQVGYQLSSTPGPNGTVWGSTTLNSIAGTGTGSATSYTVYATVPNANYTPGDYADTVTVNVTY